MIKHGGSHRENASRSRCDSLSKERMADFRILAWAKVMAVEMDRVETQEAFLDVGVGKTHQHRICNKF
jgi:hypothetical protein